MKIDRMQAFSDGVYAILITILVLDFKVPDYQAGHLLLALFKQWPTMFAYIISFLYIGTIWLFHHDFFQTLKKTNASVNVINLVMLFSVTLIDFPTALVANTLISKNSADMQVAFIYYDFVALFISFTFAWLYTYVRKHPELTTMKANQKRFYAAIKYDPVRSVSIYGVAILMTFISIWVGAMLLLAGIIYHFIAYLRLSYSIRHVFIFGEGPDRRNK
ncbi:TMEM175 family protein [Pediococcus siamensis]|uniref:TMEM175 family protein n=1 Tax=Pediococcus siamensis TaxID=381829 RepID=UPI00399FB334